MGDYVRSLKFGVIVNADHRGYEPAPGLVRRADEAGLDDFSGSSVNKSPADVPEAQEDQRLAQEGMVKLKVGDVRRVALLGSLVNKGMTKGKSRGLYARSC